MRHDQLRLPDTRFGEEWKEETAGIKGDEGGERDVIEGRDRENERGGSCDFEMLR